MQNIDYIEHFEEKLRASVNTSTIPSPKLRDAILYTLFPGGKRLRPLLIYLCGELLSVSKASLDTMAVAMELVHCYSLVHDDLPAMDDDDTRRGLPSCHIQFDEATAILAGDGMQALATEILLNELPKHLNFEQTIQITKVLAQASGVSGMISGQALDLSELSKQSLTESQLAAIHHLKTGQLITACIQMPLKAAKPSKEQSKSLLEFAKHLGLVFQMQDDYLDRWASKNHGKDRTSDIENNKTTYASLYTQKELYHLIITNYEKTQAALAPFGQGAKHLHRLISQLEHRIQPPQKERRV